MVEKAEILLVDDHALILEGICHILKRLPEVVVANAVTTGEEAVGLIAERDYDIYILDVGLPDVSGFELIDMIRELNEDARIIVNTMHEEIWYINRLHPVTHSSLHFLLQLNRRPLKLQNSLLAEQAC